MECFVSTHSTISQTKLHSWQRHDAFCPRWKDTDRRVDPHSEADQWYVYDYFKESIEIDKGRYPASSSLRTWMREAGFRNCITQAVEHWTYRLPTHEILRQGRLDKTATSQLSVLTDAEYERGTEQIHANIERAEAKGETLLLTADLRSYRTIGSIAER